MAGYSKSNMSFEVGKPVAVDLSDGTSLRGFVHAEDKAAGLVCLELIPSSDVALIAAKNVKTIANLNDVTAKRKWPVNPAVDAGRLRAEQERAFRKRHEEFENIGVGVSASAQAIFDTLAKTLPCRWEQDEIVILDSVHLAPPYDVGSISGDGDAGVVQRVKMILEREAKAIRSVADTNGVTR